MNIELEEHTKADYDYQTTVATVVSIARRAKQIFESSEDAEKRVFLSFLLQNSTVSGKTFIPQLRSPFDLLLDAPIITLLDIVRDIGTFWKTNKEHIWLPNIKQGFFGITRPTAEEMRKYK